MWGPNDTISITWFWFSIFKFLLHIFLFFTLTVRGWNHQKKKSNKTDLKNSLTTMANKFLILMEKTSKETNLFTFHKKFQWFSRHEKPRVCLHQKKNSKFKITDIYFYKSVRHSFSTNFHSSRNGHCLWDYLGVFNQFVFTCLSDNFSGFFLYRIYLDLLPNCYRK